MTTVNMAPPYQNDVETIPRDEDEDIQSVIQALKLVLARNQSKTGEFHADVHVKTHGDPAGSSLVSHPSRSS